MGANQCTCGQLANRQSDVTHENVNIQHSYQGCAILHLAVRRGCIGCVRWLVEERGAAIHIRDQYDETPLHDCLIFGQEQVLIELLRLGGNVNVLKRNGETLINRAIALSKGSSMTRCKRFVGILLDFGAKICITDPHIPTWVVNLAIRKSCQKAAIALIGIRKMRWSILDTNVQDITRMIAKMIWSARTQNAITLNRNHFANLF